MSIPASSFSIGGTGINPPGNKNVKEYGRKSENKFVSKPDEEVKDTVEVKSYILLESLLPTTDTWLKTNRTQRASRVRFLIGIAVLYIVLWSSHLPIAIWKSWSIASNAQLKRLLSDRPGVGHPLPANCMLTKCAALCPASSETRDWYTLFGVPYATLPQQNAYFALPTSPYSFKECYLAYWHGVSKHKRNFVNGQMRFIGTQAHDDDSECSQLKSKNGSAYPVGKPQSCLSLSFHFPWFKEENKKGPAMPIVAYIGGSYFLQHRPQLPSSNIAAAMRILYVSIGYRLGVFGFSDFHLEGNGPNHGVEDVRAALAWIQENAHKFGGDPARVLLYGEDSGGTVAAALHASNLNEFVLLNGERRSLFTHVWLAEGSVVIPPSSTAEDSFLDLVINDPELDNYCKLWTDKHGSSYQINRNHPLAQKFNCLVNLTVKQWLLKTPVEWLISRVLDSEKIPQLGEKRTPIIKNDPLRSSVINPLSILNPTSGFLLGRMRDIPVVIYSNMNQPHDFSPPSNLTERWSLNDAEQKVKEALNTFGKAASQLPYADAIWNAYQGYLFHFQAWRNNDQGPHEIDYKILYDIIRNDLRGACTYNVYAKYLQLSGNIQISPIYRILNRVKNQPYTDENGARCDIPFFLIDEEFSCGKGTRPLYESLRTDQKEVLIRAFMQFAYYGDILGMKPMAYPTRTGMDAAETTYNILSEMGLTTAGSREVGLLNACKVWTSEEGEFEHVMKYGRMN